VDRCDRPLAVRNGDVRGNRALHTRGELALQKDFVHEGLLGTRFVGRLIEETTVGDYPAVVPTLSGQAWITGRAEYVLDETDPFPEGFTVGDIWA
jgi:proline racemase